MTQAQRAIRAPENCHHVCFRCLRALSSINRNHRFGACHPAGSGIASLMAHITPGQDLLGSSVGLPRFPFKSRKMTPATSLEVPADVGMCTSSDRA